MKNYPKADWSVDDYHFCSYKGFLAGVQVAYDLTKSSLVSNNFVFGMEGSDFSGFASV